MSSRPIFENSGGKLLTFKLGEQEYGIQILDTREVISLMEIDPVPQTPKFMKGVINLRGQIIPVIDLRTKFGMPETNSTGENCIVVVDLGGKLTGIVVDLLIGVVTIEEKEYEDSPDLGSNINADFILGMAKLEKRVIIILEMRKIMSNDELKVLHAS